MTEAKVPRRDKLNILLLFRIEKVETRASVTRINFMLLWKKKKIGIAIDFIN